MNAKDEGQQKAEETWRAYPTTPGKGTAGWAFIRQLEGAYDFHGYVFGMDSYDGPNGPATLLARHLNKMETHLNALQQQVRELEGKAARYEKALERISDREGMPWTQYRKKWNLIPWWDGTDSLSAAEIARDALNAPSTITQEEQR